LKLKKGRKQRRVINHHPDQLEWGGGQLEGAMKKAQRRQAVTGKGKKKGEK